MRKGTNRSNAVFPAAFFLAAALAAVPAYCQDFGKNQLVTRDFKYRIWETEHFRIHYYEDNPLLMEETAKYLEAAYEDITRRLGAKPAGKLPFFLYTNHNEFEQNRIVHVGEGTGGVTEAFKDRFLVFNNGSMQWLRHVIFHEFAHEVEFAILNAGFWKSVRLLKMILYPLWMMEGISEYFSGKVDAVTDAMYARDLATSKTAPAFSLKKLHNFNHLKPNQITRAYKQGALVIHYIAEEYGEDKIGKILKSFWERFDINAVLLDVLGITLDRLDANFREWLEETYSDAAQGLEEPSRYGVMISRRAPPIPVYRMSPVLSPDGKRLYYIGLREGFPALYEQEIPSGKRRILAGKEYFKLDWIDLSHRNLALSVDGRYLYFTGEKKLEEYLFRYDLHTGKLERRRFEALQWVQSPAVDPMNSSRVAVSGMDNGFTDIYVVDFEKGEIERRITSDPQDDNFPVFLPGGEGLLYSTEVALSTEGVANRNLYFWSAKTGSVSAITRGARVETMPAVSADGKRVLFISDALGTFDLYELELDSGKVWRKTRVITGMFAPSYAQDGIVFVSLRDGEMDVYLGRPEQFLSEDATEIFDAKPVAPPESEPVSIIYRGNYRTRFSTDLFFPAFFFSTEGGLFALAYWQGSDMLGYHTLTSALIGNTGAGEMNYSVTYALNRWRTQWALLFRGLHTRDPAVLSDRGEDLRKKEHFQGIRAAYPLDRFHRVESILGLTERHHDFPSDPVALTNLQEIAFTLQFVRDTVTAPYLVATRGSRFEIGAKKAARIAEFDLEFLTQFAQWHQYFPIGLDSTIASRFGFFKSYGPNFQSLPLGGRRGVRGYPQERDMEQRRANIFNNVEFRFPLLKDLNYHMWFMFPDFYFKNIYLGIFSDQGVRWEGRTRDVFDEWAIRRKQDFLHSVGLSLKINMFILQTFPFFLSFDWAKRTTQSGSVFYGSIFQFFTFGSVNK